MRISLLLCVFTLFLSYPIDVSAQTKDQDSAVKALGLPQSANDVLREAGQGRVARIISPLTIQLADGRLVTLAGLDAPDFNPYQSGKISLTAMKVMNDLLLDQDIVFFQYDGLKRELIKNRMGHILAHVTLEDRDIWIQALLLELGLARVRTIRDMPVMAEAMYALEEKARIENIGLWALPDYSVINQNMAGQYSNSFQIVQGRVVSTARRQNRIFINFGQNWRNDFTVAIDPDHRRSFFDRGLDPLSLNGKEIRVRGWIEDYNGPYIEIDHPERIEVLGNKG